MTTIAFAHLHKKKESRNRTKKNEDEERAVDEHPAAPAEGAGGR